MILLTRFIPAPFTEAFRKKLLYQQQKHQIVKNIMGGKKDSLVTRYQKTHFLKGEGFEQLHISKLLERHFCVPSREEQTRVVC